jgi:pyrroline-5-carboxylate reductase
MTTHSATDTLGDFPGRLVLVGAGKMGAALLENWLGLGLDAKNIVVLEPQPSVEVSALVERGLALNPAAASVASAAALVIAVKPQSAPSVVPGLAPFIGARTVVVSIMAGIPLRFLEQSLPAGIACVRAMPNTPAAIGRGITAALGNRQLSGAQRELAHRLLSATGAVEWIDDETLMDAVTAVSGSGPAYVFLLAEALARAGAAAGLPDSLAQKLARATVAGSGELLHRSPLDPATLRKNVTSPGGTTAAALDVLMGDDGLEALLRRAVVAAARRSRELAG